MRVATIGNDLSSKPTTLPLPPSVTVTKVESAMPPL